MFVASKNKHHTLFILLFILLSIHYHLILSSYYVISWSRVENSSVRFEKWLYDPKSHVNISVAYLFSACQCDGFELPYVQIERINKTNTRFSISVIDPVSEENKRRVLNYNLDELNGHQIGCDLYNVLKRGRHQKIISYSLYGTNPKYYNNIERILQVVPAVYKGHTVRIYYDHTVNETLRCQLECKYSSVVDFCNVDRFVFDLASLLESERVESKNLTYMNKMMWRFLPIGDTFVDVFMSRDTDSLFSQRETDSVNVWMNSTNYGHIMRDHPMHGFYILGGMWGLRTHLDRRLSNRLFVYVISEWVGKNYNLKGKTAYNADQDFLRDYVYGVIKCKSTIHDSYKCMTYLDSKPFPTRRQVDDFVGSVVVSVTSQKKIEILKCPVECRPVEHKDWEFC